MAHVVIYSVAYRGDVFPYAPIAAVLEDDTEPRARAFALLAAEDGTSRACDEVEAVLSAG